VAVQQQLVINEEMSLCLAVQQSDMVSDSRRRVIW
jgi:hypothetical protein